jgi:hypothetical protein
MAVPEFMNYLIYVEHSAENLQFYLWHQNYVKRFEEAPTSDRALAPEWTLAMEDDVLAKLQKDATEYLRQRAAGMSDIFRGTDFYRRGGDACVTEGNPFSRAPGTGYYEKRTNAFRAHRAFGAAGARIPCEYYKTRPTILEREVN